MKHIIFDPIEAFAINRASGQIISLVNQANPQDPCSPRQRYIADEKLLKQFIKNMTHRKVAPLNVLIQYLKGIVRGPAIFLIIYLDLEIVYFEYQEELLSNLIFHSQINFYNVTKVSFLQMNIKKNQILQLEEYNSDHSDNEQEASKSINKIKKVFLPQEYHKAKRSVNRLILQYFTALRQQVQKGGSLYLNRSRFEGISTALTYYVGLRYGDKKQNLEFNLRLIEDVKKKQLRNGLFSYLSECQKIINYSQQGRINLISLQKGNIKLPDLATPVPFQDSIYLLDPSDYDQKRRAFVPRRPNLVVSYDGKVKQIASPNISRQKCAIIKDKQGIYLLGGYAGDQKIISKKCQKYRPSTNTYEQMPSLLQNHHCPSACLHNGYIWVFSSQGLQYFENNKWKIIELGWNIKFLPFQFIYSLNQNELLILGGMINNQKSSQIKIYNIKDNKMINYGPILPQGICNQRSWGPCLVHGCIGVISSIQASVYPQVGVKSNMSSIIYVHENSAYLNCIINV